MNALCPNCEKALPWWKLRNEFNCPHCASPLFAKTTGAFFATVVLWVLADIPVKLFLFEVFGTESFTGILARVFVCGAIGCALAFLIIGGFSTITARHAS